MDIISKLDIPTHLKRILRFMKDIIVKYNITFKSALKY